MRKIFTAAVMAAVVHVAPATATTEPALQIEQYAPLPCTVACPYWDVAETAGFDACSAPFPQGSFDVTRFRITGPGLVRIAATSVVDYDTFLCTTGPEQEHATTCRGSQVCTWVPQRCNGLAGVDAIAVGCTEQLFITLGELHVRNGGINDEFLLRSYNWSDYAPLPITLTGPVEVIDDSYEATAL